MPIRAYKPRGIYFSNFTATRNKLNIMHIETITDKIRKIADETGATIFVAICGWADTGKTTLARKLCSLLNIHSVPSDFITTDSFMLERAERNRSGISGYNPGSIREDALAEAMDILYKKHSYTYFHYDNRTGRNSDIHRTIQPSRVIIIEGIHAFNESIREQMHLKIFIDSTPDILKALRFNANIHKRGFCESEAKLRIDSELGEFIRFVLPLKESADMIINVDCSYNYKIIRH